MVRATSNEKDRNSISVRDFGIIIIPSLKMSSQTRLLHCCSNKGKNNTFTYISVSTRHHRKLVRERKERFDFP